MERDSRAVLAFVFGLVGGVITLVSLAVFGGFFYPYGYFGLFGAVGFFLTIVAGAFVILGASLTFRKPAQGVTWGIVMVVFGSLSAFGLGGFFIGMSLSIAGGALAIVAGASPVASAPTQLRACTSCGMLNPIGFAHCPHCGHAVGVLRG